jgi:hypothetical protein
MFRRGKFALLTGAVMALLLSACAVASIPAAQEEQAGGAATPAAASEDTDSMTAATHSGMCRGKLSGRELLRQRTAARS